LIRVAHIGPDPASDGGMASVLRQYEAAAWRSTSLRFITSWRPGSRTKGLIPTVQGAWTLFRNRQHLQICHVHLSEGGSFVREGFFLLLASALGLRRIATLHGADLHAFASSHPRLVAFVLGRCDRIVVLGRRDAAFVAASRPGSQVRVIPNPQGVHAQGSRPGIRHPVVFMAGEIGTRKGVDRLLEAWPTVKAMHPEARLRLAGPLKDISEDLLEGPGIEYMWNLTRAEVEEQIARSVLCCLPSRREVLPMFILEALAAGRPVVATPIGEVPELRPSGAVILTKDDASDLATQLSDALGRIETHLDLAEAARPWLIANVGLESVTERLEQLYEEVLV